MEDVKISDLHPKETFIVPKNSKMIKKGIYLDSKDDHLRITENGIQFLISDDYYYDEDIAKVDNINDNVIDILNDLYQEPTKENYSLQDHSIYPQLVSAEFIIDKYNSTTTISQGPSMFLEYFVKLVDLININIKNKKIKKIIIESKFPQLDLLLPFRKLYPTLAIFLLIENKIIIDKLK
jgi:hypothetical protein